MSNTTYFVAPGSIVREIWGDSDTILLIFGGAAAEFAVNKSVDWLYFTGKLPKDPIGRLFSTVAYAQQIVFSNSATAMAAIEKINMIHQHVETARGYNIPQWAYRDVLYMLIDYSIRSFELLNRPLTPAEKEDIFDVFIKMGVAMEIEGLPDSFAKWTLVREQALDDNLEWGSYSKDLYKQYKRALGNVRYRVLISVQKRLVPAAVYRHLEVRNWFRFLPIIRLLQMTRYVHLSELLIAAIFPVAHKGQLKMLKMSEGNL